MTLEPIEQSKEAVGFLKTMEKIYLFKDIDAIQRICYQEKHLAGTAPVEGPSCRRLFGSEGEFSLG